MNSLSLTSRRIAATSLIALATGAAATSSAQAATVSLDLGSGPIVSVDTQAVVTTVADVRVAAVDLVQAKLRQANAGVVAPTANRVANVLRASGVTAFAVVDRSGRVLRGPGVVGVNTRRGVLDVVWANDFRGCLQVALNNTLLPRGLDLDMSMPLHTRVTSGSGKARASLRNVTVAVVC